MNEEKKYLIFMIFGLNIRQMMKLNGISVKEMKTERLPCQNCLQIFFVKKLNLYAINWDTKKGTGKPTNGIQRRLL